MTAAAFDGERKGFILGGSLGGGIIHYNREIKDSNINNENDNAGAFSADIMIGYGITDKFLLYYINKYIWFSTDRVSGEKAAFVNSMGPVGISYYFNSKAPSPVINFGLGFAHLYAPLESGQELDYGKGIYTGIGYEFSKHYALNINYMYSRTNVEDRGIKTGTEAHSVVLAFSVLCF